MAETTPNNVGVAGGSQAPTPRDAEANKPKVRHEPKKIIRLMTVIAYMMSVSMAAVMLSAYYIFLWKPKEHRPGPLRLSDPCPECFITAAGGVNHGTGLVNLAQPPHYNDSQVFETPRVLPAKEELPTTPLSQFAQDYLDLDLQKDNYTLPVPVHS